MEQAKQVSNKKADQSIRTTSDYGIFKRLNGNREINKMHVNSLMKSMQEDSVDVPIICNEKMEVMDGAHRLEAYIRLKQPVPYIIINGLTLIDTIRLNAHQKNWGIDDYVKSYASQGLKDYKMICSFSEVYGTTMIESAALLDENAAYGGVRNKMIKSGQFKVGSFKRAEQKHIEIAKLKELCKEFNGYRMIEGYLRVSEHPNFKFETLIRKAKARPDMLHGNSDVMGYIRMFEDIHNHASREKDRVWINFKGR